MTTITRETAVRSNPLSGFTNLFQKEMRGWWRTKTWWVHLLVYMLMINGMTALVAIQGQQAGLAQAEIYAIFLVFHLIFAIGGVIITAQGTIVGEKELGTAAWILSKPVSRSAYLLSKAAALTLNCTAVSVLIPSIIAYVTWYFIGMAPTPDKMIILIFGLALSVGFFVSFTLLLGALFDSRKAVGGLGFLMLFVQIQLGQRAMGTFLPSGINFQLPQLLAGRGLPSLLPYGMAALLTVLLLATALWRFDRTEF